MSPIQYPRGLNQKFVARAITIDVSPEPRQLSAQLPPSSNIGALIIRIGFWGPLYYIYNKEPPQNSIGNYLGPYSSHFQRQKSDRLGTGPSLFARSASFSSRTQRASGRPKKGIGLMGPKTHISISMLWGYLYPILGFMIKGLMGYGL